jgi:hypothetical protein
MNLKLTNWVAYEIGVHVGDGNMYSYNRTHRITYSGNLANEKKFYKEFLTKLIKRIYKVQPRYYERKADNTVLLVINSKELVEFKNKFFELPIGTKDEIEIPKVIRKDTKLIKWFMKGLGDTDFSLSFKKDRKGLHSQPRLELYTKSKKLFRQVCEILRKFGFTFGKNIVKKRKHKGYMVRIYGKQNLQLWLKNFGFFNPWILSKIKIWKKLGYFPIKKTRSFRSSGG